MHPPTRFVLLERIMKRRTWKYVALVVTGSVLFQAATCATLLSELLIQQLNSALFAAFFAAFTGGTGNGGGGG